MFHPPSVWSEIETDLKKVDFNDEDFEGLLLQHLRERFLAGAKQKSMSGALRLMVEEGSEDLTLLSHSPENVRDMREILTLWQGKLALRHETANILEGRGHAVERGFAQEDPVAPQAA